MPEPTTIFWGYDNKIRREAVLDTELDEFIGKEDTNHVNQCLSNVMELEEEDAMKSHIGKTINDRIKKLAANEKSKQRKDSSANTANQESSPTKKVEMEKQKEKNRKRRTEGHQQRDLLNATMTTPATRAMIGTTARATAAGTTTMRRARRRFCTFAISFSTLFYHATFYHATVPMEIRSDFSSYGLSPLQTLIRNAPPLELPMQVIILTMNRFSSVKRLLASLQGSEYGGDTIHLTIRWDKSSKPIDSQGAFLSLRENITNTLEWPHGTVTTYFSPENIGLRQAWIDAWHPETNNEHAIILEDDITVSPAWYAWYKQAVARYPAADSLSLQRQQLVPEIMMKEKPQGSLADMEGKHFLYPLVGSIGFAPRSHMWRDFVSFANCAIANDVDVSTPGLVTSEWYKRVKKSGMWTQLYIYYSQELQLHTLYFFPAQGEALAAHHREKGGHFGNTLGADFVLVKNIPMDAFESQVSTLDWGARKVIIETPLTTVVVSVAVGYELSVFESFISSVRHNFNGDIMLLISHTASSDILKYLGENNIQTQATELQGGPHGKPEWLRVNQARWTFYADVCDIDSYDHCIIVDFRDVMFQSNPHSMLRKPDAPALFVYQHNLLMNAWHLSEAKKCGLGQFVESLRDNYIINAGCFVATPTTMHHLVAVLSNLPSGCDDQVALNVALYGYGGLLAANSANVVPFKQGTGLINNMAWDGVFQIDEVGRILNLNCFPSPILHQYDIVKYSGTQRQPFWLDRSGPILI